MKTTVLLIVALFFSIPQSFALKGIKSKPIPGVNVQLLNHLAKDPVRIIDGKTNNISALARSAASMQLFDSGVSQGPDGWCFIVGKVAQIIRTGILCKVYANPDGQTKDVLLKNYPGQKTATDGEKIFVIAKRSGNFNFVGTGETVEAYDYGTIPDKKGKPVENPLPKAIPPRILTEEEAREEARKAAERKAETERKVQEFRKQREQEKSK